MPRDNEHLPGERSPTAGRYAEMNVFGTPTGKVVRTEEGEVLPLAPRGFTWRRVLQEGS
jgi:hypothetical protein